jgi:hypothetical protein
MRERRARLGELIQIDGSPHDWFEGRGEYCTLLVFIDDATGKRMQLEAETQFSRAARELVMHAFTPTARRPRGEWNVPINRYKTGWSRKCVW